jgi:ribosomal protein L37AE/L43A
MAQGLELPRCGRCGDTVAEAVIAGGWRCYGCALVSSGPIAFPLEARLAARRWVASLGGRL